MVKYRITRTSIDTDSLRTSFSEMSTYMFDNQSEVING